MSAYSPYKGAKLGYKRDYDPNPIINVDVTTKMDIERAIKRLYIDRMLSEQELQMLRFVMLDGRLSRRDISKMIQEQEGYYVDQRTVSRRLESAYFKISKELGFEYSDSRVFKMIAKARGHPYPYILSDDDIDKIQQIWERI
jgi:hypothetical protein